MSKALMRPLYAAAVAAALAGPLRADEGMWLYNNPPREQLKQRYGFELTDAWLDHLQKSSVRFNSGGSGSFVSEDGLVLSNHHVGADALQKVGSEKHNYLRDGFHARTPAEEIKCVDLELNVLQSIEDVTARVNAGVPAGLSASDAAKARRKVIAGIEKESLEKTKLRSNVVTLYQGGAYHLYRFKRYTDVRLVFAPEQQIAFYGGDPDNFEFPRFDLDICLFRVYEDGKPVKVEHHLKWSKNGAADGELTFVSGHPGRTDRGLTVAELEFLRDVQYPALLGRLRRLDSLLQAWSARSDENARRAREDFFGVQNSRKAREGGLAGLQDPAFIARKAAAEAAFKKELADAGGFDDALGAYDRIAAAEGEIGTIVGRHRLLETGQGFSSETFTIARHLLRAAAEQPKPNGERLREYTDSEKASFELGLYSEKPIYEDYEILRLSDALGWLVEQAGAGDPLVQRVLDGKSPRARAVELIRGSKVRDLAVRKALHHGGAAAVEAAHDPMIELARIIDPEARELRRKMEAADETRQQAHAAISKARFKLHGASGYPDATFTLRLAFGPVKGYDEDGRHIAPITTFAGLYERTEAHHGRPPFDLPPRWLKKKGAAPMGTPFNFVSTADIIGGNSGSPVVNRAGEFVGIIFDGNLQSLVLDFGYDDVQARALSVHSSGILEALNSVYGAGELARELRDGRRP
jgi:Peptidase S46